MKQETDFDVKPITDIIKVKDCTYSNEDFSKQHYYFCKCTSSEFFPVCSHCAKICHRHISTEEMMTLEDKFICACGKNNHRVNFIISKELADPNRRTKCIFGKFYKEDLGYGFYNHFGNKICSICWEFCLDRDVNEKENWKGIDNKECECGFLHSSDNVFKINWDIINKKDFDNHFIKFNFNVIGKIEYTNLKYYKYFHKKVRDYKNKVTSKQNSEDTYNREFFNDEFIFKIFELYYYLTYEIKGNKYDQIVGFFEDLNFNTAIDLLKINHENVTKVQYEEIRSIYCRSKMYYADFLFYYYFKKYFSKMNLISFEHVLNMNLFQRKLYIHDSKDFLIFSQKYIDEELIVIKFQEFFEVITDLYENLCKIATSLKDQSTFNIVSEIYFKIMKDLIKYNLIKDDSKQRFLERLFDVVSEQKRSVLSNHNLLNFKCSLHVMKCLFYILIYKNDIHILNQLNSNSKYCSDYVFLSNSESNTYSFLLCSILNCYQLNQENDNLKEVINFDTYVKKILNIMIGDNSSYKLSLKNLNFIRDCDLNCIISSKNFHRNLIRLTNSNSTLSHFDEYYINPLQILNEKFSSYKINFKTYIDKANNLMDQLQIWVKTSIKLPSLDLKYEYFEEEQESKLCEYDDISYVIKFTNFFTVLKHLFQNISNYEEFFSKNKNQVSINLENSNIEFLLSFIIYLINRDSENYVLFNIIDPENLSNSIYNFPQTYMFLDKIRVFLLVSPQEKMSLENYNFICRFVICLIDKLNFDSNTNFDSKKSYSGKDNQEDDIANNLWKLRKLCYFCISTFKIINLENIDNLSMIEACLNKIEKMKQYPVYDYLILFMIPEEFETNINSPSLKVEILKFIQCLLNFQTKLINSEMKFFNIFPNLENLLFGTDSYKYLVFDREFDLPIILEISLNEFFQAFDFQISFSQNAIDFIISNFYKQRSHDRFTTFIDDKNFFFNELLNSPDLQKDNIIGIKGGDKEIEVYYNYMINYMNSVENFHIKIKSITTHHDDKKTLIFINYFEKTIVRSCFTLINIVSRKHKEMNSKDCYYVYNLIYVFIECLIKFYKYLDEYVQIPKWILAYEEIGIKLLDSFGKTDLENLHKKLKKLIHLEINECLIIYRRVINLIIKTTPNKLEKKQSDNLKCPLKRKIDCVLNDYEKIIEKSYGSKLSLIKACTSYNENSFLGSNLYEYLLNKLISSITINSSSADKKDYFISNTISLYNCYVIGYLNSLFYQSSSFFQKLLEHTLEFEQVIIRDLISFLMKEMIFGNLILELKKFNCLDLYDEKDALFYEICIMSIRLLNNLCDFHNHRFQNFIIDFPIIEKLEEDKLLINQINFMSNNVINSHAILLSKPTNKGKVAVEIQNIMKNENRRKHSQAVIIKQAFRSTKMLFHNRQNSLKPKPIDLSEKDEKYRSKQKILGSKILKSKTRNVDSEELRHLKYLKCNYLGFLCLQMNMILINLNLEEHSIHYHYFNNKSYSHLQLIYSHFNFLLINLVQGTEKSNFSKFFSQLPASLCSDDNILDNKYVLDFYSFVRLSRCIRNIFFFSNYLDIVSIDVKISLFKFFNCLINQDEKSEDIIKLSLSLFSPKNLIEMTTKYLKALFLKYIKKIAFISDKFNQCVDSLVFTLENYEQLMNCFKNNHSFSCNPYFQIASEIYMFLLSLSENHKVDTINKIINITSEDIISNYSKEKFRSVVNQRFEKNKESVNKNNILICNYFFQTISRSCEFMIYSNKIDDMKIKKIFFIIDPKYYLISSNKITKFIDNADRLNPTSKLKDFLKFIPSLIKEIEFAVESSSTKIPNSILNWFECSFIDKINFLIALIINFILLISFDNSYFANKSIFYVSFFAIIQIVYNITYLMIYFYQKFVYTIYSERVQSLEILKGSFLSLILSELNIIKNHEINTTVINLFIAILGIIFTNLTILFPLQLITAMKFISTFREIIMAFILRFTDFLSLIAFLAILINFYAGMGFYYLQNEFENINNTYDTCDTLLGCYMIYFNYGIRSGGGIGEILEIKSIVQKNYWIRYINDMIFFISISILILNMVNGIIISTFSNLRQKKEAIDQEKNNSCFICSIKNVIFEKNKQKFRDHVLFDHNTKNYLKFFIKIYFMKEKNLNNDQSFILKCLKKRNIKIFPIRRCVNLGGEEIEDGNRNFED